MLNDMLLNMFITACKKGEFIHEHIKASNSSYGIEDHFYFAGTYLDFLHFLN